VFPPALTSLEQTSIACTMAHFSGRIGFRATSCDFVRFPLGSPTKALRPRCVPIGRPIEANFGGVPFAVPLPEGSGPLDVSGKWERHWLAPLPHASSFDRPATHLSAVTLANVRRFRGGSDQ
jgi:hypothetical protein